MKVILIGVADSKQSKDIPNHALKLVLFHTHSSKR